MIDVSIGQWHYELRITNYVYAAIRNSQSVTRNLSMSAVEAAPDRATDISCAGVAPRLRAVDWVKSAVRCEATHLR
jgi:hypothetical protein